MRKFRLQMLAEETVSKAKRQEPRGHSSCIYSAWDKLKEFCVLCSGERAIDRAKSFLRAGETVAGSEVYSQPKAGLEPGEMELVKASSLMAYRHNFDAIFDRQSAKEAPSRSDLNDSHD